MKVFILSYISSVAMIILGFLPSVQAAPFEMIPRIALYFGVPSAFLLSIVVLAMAPFFQKEQSEMEPESIILATKNLLKPFDNKKVA